MNNNDESVTLKEYVEAIFAEKQRALDIAFAAQQRALDIAARNLELRLEKLNELRAEVQADRSEFVKNATHGALEEKVAAIVRTQAADRAEYLKLASYNTQHTALEDKVNVLAQTQIRNENKYVTTDKYKAEVTPLQELRGKVTAIIAGSAALAAVIGYAISAAVR